MIEILILVLFVTALVMCICVDIKMDRLYESLRQDRNKLYELEEKMEEIESREK